ncbi:MAG: OmpH family outer membrane protein [Prevotellaceae bacterium]|jgi:outer membrane protein|nr:OmpH family outer membrane protein [Prevotellaceae bacterium]
MLKKISFALMLLLPACLMGQNFKFGHFNSQEITPLMEEFKKAQADYEALIKTYEDEMSRLTTEFQTKYEEFRKLMSDTANPLPQNIMDRRQKELEDMDQRIQSYRTEASQSLNNKQLELMQPIGQKLDEAVKAVGQEGGYTYIFDQSRTPIAYVNDSISTDVTALIKTKLGIL